MEEAKLDALLKYEKKLVGIGRFRLVITILIFVLIAAIAVFAVTEGLQIHSAIMAVRNDVEQINMDEVNQAIASIRKTAEEISQLLYHVQAMMIANGLTLEDVYKVL